MASPAFAVNKRVMDSFDAEYHIGLVADDAGAAVANTTKLNLALAAMHAGGSYNFQGNGGHGPTGPILYPINFCAKDFHFTKGIETANILGCGEIIGSGSGYPDAAVTGAKTRFICTNLAGATDKFILVRGTGFKMSNIDVYGCTTDVYTVVTGATNVADIVITATAHGLVTGNRVQIKLVIGNTAANGTFTFTRVNDNSGTIGVAGNGAFDVASTEAYIQKIGYGYGIAIAGGAGPAAGWHTFDNVNIIQCEKALGMLGADSGYADANGESCRFTNCGFWLSEYGVYCDNPQAVWTTFKDCTCNINGVMFSVAQTGYWNVEAMRVMAADVTILQIPEYNGAATFDIQLYRDRLDFSYERFTLFDYTDTSGTDQDRSKRLNVHFTGAVKDDFNQDPPWDESNPPWDPLDLIRLGEMAYGRSGACAFASTTPDDTFGGTNITIDVHNLPPWVQAPFYPGIYPCTTEYRDAIPDGSGDEPNWLWPGLTIFNHTTKKLNIWNGSAWRVVTDT